MSAPGEAEATIAVDAAARKAWDLRREELRDQGYATPEFDALAATEQLRVREQVLPLVWAALSAIERPAEARNRAADEIDALIKEMEPSTSSTWLGGMRQAVAVVRGAVFP